MMITPESMRSLRVSRLVVCEYLTPLEHLAIDRSFRDSRDKLRRVAFGYYRSRADNPDEAADWLVSETYTYVIDCVIAGKRAIPADERDWCAIGKTIRHRYWESLQIVIDNSPVRFLCDDDSNISTRLVADRLQLDDQAFIARLVDYAMSGMGVSDAPAWIVETITLWVVGAGLTHPERAAVLGIKFQTIKSREARAKQAVRAGIARRYGCDFTLAPYHPSLLCSGCNVATA
jgi:hypothetical protein